MWPLLSLSSVSGNSENLINSILELEANALSTVTYADGPVALVQAMMDDPSYQDREARDLAELN